MATYIAYGCGKRNHDFVLKSDKYETLFEGNLVKGRIFSASDFEFINTKLGNKVLHKVGKTVTKSSGTTSGAISVSTVKDSYFKLDGEKVFDVLAKKGYMLRCTATGLIKNEVSLFKGNTVVAVLKLNEKGPRQENVSGIGNTQRNTVITSDLEDLEVLFLAAFIMSRVEMSARLM